MRILQFGKHYPPAIGGMENVIYNLTTGLNKRGLRCDVLCSNIERMQVMEQHDGFTIQRAKSYGTLSSMSLAPGIIRLLSKINRQYDVIHFHHPDPMSAFALWLVRPKCKLIVHWHLDIIKQKVAYFFYRPIEKWLLRRADRIIVTSPNYLESSVPLRLFKSKCTVVPIGIPQVPKSPVDRQNELRKDYSGKFITFALGRFTEYKGFDQLIKAATYLPDNHLVLIGGDGHLRRRFEEMIETRRLTDKVKLLGRIPDSEVVDYYSLCDVFCLPSVSRNEAFGIVMLEAMSLGKTVIATNIPGSGTSWVNTDKVTGINVEPRNPEALANAIKLIADNPSAKDAYARGAKKRFDHRFLVDRMIESTIDVYRTNCG